MGNSSSPQDDEEKETLDGIILSDLIDIKAFQNLMDSYHALTEMPTAILDLDGNILVASGWRKICTQFHRKHAVTASRCLQSDTVLAGNLSKGERFNSYRCRNGLIDVAAPIIIGGMHLGNLFAGQFLFEKPDHDFFSKQADQFGFDKEKYLDALEKVPVFSEDQIKKFMEYLTDLTIVIGSAGIDRKKALDLSNGWS